MFGRMHGSMFGRTLFEYCVWKDTLHYIRKDTFQNMINKPFNIDYIPDFAPSAIKSPGN